MKALILSFVGTMTKEVKDVIIQYDKSIIIDSVSNTLDAATKVMKNYYDIIVIDMMIQENNKDWKTPAIKSGLNFLKTHISKQDIKLPRKVFALFDRWETSNNVKDIVKNLGYAYSYYDGMSDDWKRELVEYLKS